MFRHAHRSTPWLCGFALAAGALLGLFWYTASPGGVKPSNPSAAGSPPAPDDASGLALEAAEREFLWQVEHHGLVLSRHGFQALGGALRSANAAALAALLAADFTGSDLRQPRET